MPKEVSPNPHPSPKGIEQRAFQKLKEHLEKSLNDSKKFDLEFVGNRGRREGSGIADAILTYDGKVIHIEIKARSGPIGTNIRFTHQTITKALGHNLIVALVSELNTKDEPVFNFFSLGSVQDNITVEPHFIIQRTKISEEQELALQQVLKNEGAPLSLDELLVTKISDHMRKI